MSEKLDKLKEIMKTVNDGLTREEFLTAFKQVLELVKANKLASEKERTALETRYSQIVADLKKGSGEVVDETKKEATDFLASELKKIQAKIDLKMSEVKNGVAGKDADETRVAEIASKLALETLKPLMPTVEAIEQDLPKLGAEIRDGLELLPDGDKLKIEAIQDLREELDDLEKKILAKVNSSGNFGGGGVGKTNMYYYDLTPYLNGVTLTFNMPAFLRILKIETWSGPVLRPLVDWTSDASAHTVTFTIDPATYLATGQTCLVYYAI